LSNFQIILIALIVVGGRLVIDFSQRIIEGQLKVGQQRELEAEIERLLAEQRDLEAAKAYYSSPSYVEYWAHNEGKMVREGERLVIPLYDEPRPEVVELPASGPGDAPAPIPVWQVWWSLFFDSSPPLNQPPQS
jgi:hypothetical protein